MPPEAPAALPLFCRDEGTGPAVVLLHGVGADHSVWNGIVGPLSERFRVLAPDLRGHGRSAAPTDAGYALAALQGDLLGLLSSKGVAAAHLVGLSAGALLALRVGLDAPERVLSVTLISGAAYTDGHTRSVAERWAETYAQEGADALALRLLKDVYYPDWIEAHMDVADRLRAEVPRHDYRGAVRWAKEVATFDERGRIASLRPPALIVQAMDDEVVDASHGRILRQSIPGSRIRILAQTGHMVPVERPAETVEAIRSFVDEVEAARTTSAPAGLSRPPGMERP
ncbi:MAG TPA: alpha/beta fold hydrolase [Thermoplasmata archaeon]|nr:alpha/beta fold hydrolase [Thermoplasmata archaeon]